AAGMARNAAEGAVELQRHAVWRGWQCRQPLIDWWETDRPAKAFRGRVFGQNDRRGQHVDIGHGRDVLKLDATPPAGTCGEQQEKQQGNTGNRTPFPNPAFGFGEGSAYCLRFGGFAPLPQNRRLMAQWPGREVPFLHRFNHSVCAFHKCRIVTRIQEPASTADAPLTTRPGPARIFVAASVSSQLSLEALAWRMVYLP